MAYETPNNPQGVQYGADQTKAEGQPAYGHEGNGLPQNVDQPIEGATGDVSTVEGAIDALNEPQRTAPPPAKDIVEAKNTVDTERDDIAEGFAARRRQQNTNPETPGESTSGVDQTDDKVPPISAQPVEIDPNSLHRITVNGQEHWVKYSDLIATGQLKSAAEQEFAKAKQLVSDARRLMPAPQDQRSGTEPATQPTSRQPDPRNAKPAFDKDRLKDVVDSLQTGGVDEAAEKLQGLLEEVVPRQPSVDDGHIRQVFREEQVLTENRKSSAEATQQFMQKFPAVQDDRAARGAFIALSEDEYLKDMVNASGMSVDELKAIMPTPMAVLHGHRTLRAQGVSGLRDEAAVLAEVGKNPRFAQIAAKQGEQPIRYDVNVNRGERKALVQPQPVHRTAPPKPSDRGIPVSRERTYGDAFAEMKNARHQ